MHGQLQWSVCIEHKCLTTDQYHVYFISWGSYETSKVGFLGVKLLSGFVISTNQIVMILQTLL